LFTSFPFQPWQDTPKNHSTTCGGTNRYSRLSWIRENDPDGPFSHLATFGKMPTFRVIVRGVVDPCAHRVRSHQPRIVGLQHLGHCTNITESRIEPQVVVISRETDWHSVVNHGCHSVRCLTNYGNRLSWGDVVTRTPVLVSRGVKILVSQLFST
jgi:hypothetical protein